MDVALVMFSVCPDSWSALSSSVSQLVLTVGLLAVVVYLYTVVAFNFFRKFYNKGEDGELPDMKCDDMLTVSMTRVLLLGAVLQSDLFCFKWQIQLTWL